MQQIADFHIHSKYSRACSKDLTLENIDKACRVKGIDIIGTGDFTYPDWFFSIKEELEEITPQPPLSGGQPNPPTPLIPPASGAISNTPPSKGGGGNTPLIRGARGVKNDGVLYKLKSAADDRVKFILTTELALIYKANDKCRRIHIVLHAPNIEAVLKLNNYLDKKYNIRSDGRPILGMSAVELAKICFSIHPKFMIYPAHIWTPWFSVFGSKSGFDKLEECFGEYTKDIFAYETGLSSDPEMNWRLSALDKLTLLSNSDAHSLPNLAREANVFELDEVSYDEIYEIIKNKKVCPVNPPTPPFRRGEITAPPFERGVGGLKYSIEFYPEEGMYHYDGHRDCGVSFTPVESKRHKNICPVCKKPLTIGVMNRVHELADRSEGFTPKNAPGFKKLVELDKIIAEALNIKSRSSQKVQTEYKKLISALGTELYILMDAPISDIKKASLPAVAEGIKRVREGKLIIKPGFDGEYGKVKIFSDSEKKKQNTLF